MRAACPHLLAVDHPFIAIFFGLGADARKVGTGGGFGKKLAPNFIAAHRRFKIARNDLWLAVRKDSRNAHAKADGVKAGRHMKLAFFGVEDDLVHWRCTLPAQSLWPCNTNIACGIFLRLPRLRTRNAIAAFNGFAIF